MPVVLNTMKLNKSRYEIMNSFCVQLSVLALSVDVVGYYPLCHAGMGKIQGYFFTIISCSSEVLTFSKVMVTLRWFIFVLVVVRIEQSFDITTFHTKWKANLEVI